MLCDCVRAVQRVVRDFDREGWGAIRWQAGRKRSLPNSASDASTVEGLGPSSPCQGDLIPGTLNRLRREGVEP